MAIKITDLCINCGACAPECPNGAIYANGENWKLSDKTDVHGSYTLKSGAVIEGDTSQPAVSDDFFFIVSDKCTECKGFHEEPQCASVCPVDCCVADPDNVESDDDLLGRKSRLHAA